MDTGWEHSRRRSTGLPCGSHTGANVQELRRWGDRSSWPRQATPAGAAGGVSAPLGTQQDQEQSPAPGRTPRPQRASVPQGPPRPPTHNQGAVRGLGRGQLFAAPHSRLRVKHLGEAVFLKKCHLKINTVAGAFLLALDPQGVAGRQRLGVQVAGGLPARAASDLPERDASQPRGQRRWRLGRAVATPGRENCSLAG